MSALSAIEAGSVDEVSARGFEMAADASALPRHGFVLVTGFSQAGAAPTRSVRAIRPAALGSAHPIRPAVPLRLTRRGRAVVAVVAVVLAAVVITIIAMAAPGGAQAANHGRAGAGYQGMRQIVVQPGQTLWSIASKAEPVADPRLVIDQIMTVNAMTSAVIQVGQLLWVPR
jgi:hypothetical protein